MKKLWSRIRRAPAALLCLVCLIQWAAAYPPVDPEKTVSATLTYTDSAGQTPLRGMTLRLYQVAVLEGQGGIRLREEWSGAQVELNTEEANWPAAAETLGAYAGAHKDQTADTIAIEGVTDRQGTLRAAGVPAGVYLILAEPVSQDGLRYAPLPLLLTLPVFRKEMGKWEYDAAISLRQKGEPETEDPEERTLSVTAEKIWQDEERTDRPREVEVTLLRNGVPYDSAVLSAETQWKAVWRQLPAGDQWSLTETVPDGYTVLVERTASGDRLSFRVINTAKEPEEPTPGNPEEPGEPGVPEEPVLEVPGTPEGPELPRTGGIWQQVQLTGALGLGLLVLGRIVGRKRHE